MKFNWIDVVHYGSSLLLLGLAAMATLGIQLPGVEVNPATAAAAGLGVLVAGWKGPAK
jgi:hypothetical protein